MKLLTLINSKEDKQLDAFVTIKNSAPVEDIDYDQHTTASLATNQLHLKLKEMNAELIKVWENSFILKTRRNSNETYSLEK